MKVEIHRDMYGREIKRFIDGHVKRRLEDPSSLEQEMLKFLTNLGYVENSDFFREFIVTIGKTKKYIDFCFPYDKIGIEVNGWYHERNEESKDDDKLRDKKLMRKGYRIYRFSRKELVESDPKDVLKRLCEILRNVKPMFKIYTSLKRTMICRKPPNWMLENL